jgi:HEAT repeat protein
MLAAEADVGKLTDELTGQQPAAERTPEQLDTVYARVLDSLMPDMGNEDPAKRAAPQGLIERIAFFASRPGADAERAACSKAIAAKLGSGVGPLGQVWLLRQLERIGRAEAVPAVAQLLASPDALVRESARRALQENPAAEANAALVQALGAANTVAWRVAIINALGQRKDTSNLDILLKEAAADHDDVRMAALIGLAKLGDHSAGVPILVAMGKGSPRAKGIAADCLLRLAEAVAAKGDKAAALDIYKRLLASQGHLRCAGLIGIGRVGSAADLPTLFLALADADVKVRGAGVEALCLLTGPEVTAAIALQLKTAQPLAKVALLQALARRGDKSTLPVFIAAVNDADESVRGTALAGLGVIGNASAVPLLLKAAATNGLPQESARQGLQSLPGADIDQALLGALNEQDPPIRLEVIRALAARHVVAATQSLLKAAGDANADVRNESLKALGSVAASDALPALAALLVKIDDSGSRSEAAAALVKIADRDADVELRCEAILQAVASAEGPAKLALLGVLGRVGGQKPLECLRAAMKDPDTKVNDAAIRALTEWPDATAAADLLAIAKNAPKATHQVLAIRGYIRVCSIKSNRPAAETAKLLVAGLEAAQRPEEKRQALGGLREVHDLLALQAVVPCMDDAALKEEAAAAAVRIGKEICGKHPAAVKAALEKVIQVSKNDGFKKDARESLDRAEQALEQAQRKK